MEDASSYTSTLEVPRHGPSRSSRTSSTYPRWTKSSLISASTARKYWQGLIAAGQSEKRQAL